MAPAQVPHHSTPWREAHSFYLLSPLMGFLSRAWSRLRGPGPPVPWLEEAVRENQVESGLEGEVKASEAISHGPWGRHPQGEARDCRVPEVDGEAALGPCLQPKARSSPPEAWGLSDDEEHSEEDANIVPKEQGREFTDGQPVPLHPSLLIRALRSSDNSLGEEEAEGEGAAEGVIEFSCPSSHWEPCPVQEKGDENPIEREAPASTSPASSGSKLSRCVHCPGEEEDLATEEKGTENKDDETTSISPSLSGSNSRVWKCCSGERPREKGREAHEAAAPDLCSVPAQRCLLGVWEYQPRNTEEEDDDSASGAAEKGEAVGPASICSTGASTRACVCRPGEDTEDENSGLANEEREEASSPTPATSAFLKAWVYHPGEDTEEEEDSDWESADEEGEEASSPTPATSAFLKAWVYHPGEDTEEEDECEQNEVTGGDPEAGEEGEAAWGQCPSLQAQSAHLLLPGKETEEEENVEEWGETESSPFRVAIYLPGEKPPPPWAAPKLPLRLQRRLRLSQTPTQDPDPEAPLRARKVRFSEKVTVHFLAVWAGPAQAARRGPWEQFARDRSRFARRIARAQEELGPYLTPASRARAWARLGNPLSAWAPTPASTQASSSASDPGGAAAQATPPPTPSSEAPALCLDLSGRRG